MLTYIEGSRFSKLVRHVVLSFLAIGCGFGQTYVVQSTDHALPDTPRNLPTHLDSDASPLMETHGTLRLDGHCLTIALPGELLTPVWPSNFWLDGEALMSARQEVGRVGGTIYVIGGSYDYEAVRNRMTNPIPADCIRGSVFWVTFASTTSTIPSGL